MSRDLDATILKGFLILCCVLIIGLVAERMLDSYLRYQTKILDCRSVFDGR